MNTQSLITLFAAASLSVAPAFAQAPKMDAVKSDAKIMTVPINAQNGSGMSGSATLTPEGDKTRVVLQLSGAPNNVAQPAHIHDGTCAKIDAKPRWPLANVINGRSNTLVTASMDTIMKGDTAINVHKSVEDVKTYVACGDVK